DPATVKAEIKQNWQRDPMIGQKGLARYAPSKETMRTALEVIPPFLVPLSGAPMAIPVKTMLGKSRLWNFVQQVGPTVYKSLLVGRTSDMGMRIANLLDAEHYNEPELHGLFMGGGELLGLGAGAMAEKGVGAVGKAFKESPQGQTIRETLEKYTPAGETTPLNPGMTTASPAFRATTGIMEHMPGGSRLRHVREQGQQLIDDVLELFSVRFRGGHVSASTRGSVTAPVERSMLDLAAPL